MKRLGVRVISYQGTTEVEAGQKPWQTTDTQMFYDRMLNET